MSEIDRSLITRPGHDANCVGRAGRDACTAAIAPISCKRRYRWTATARYKADCRLGTTVSACLANNTADSEAGIANHSEMLKGWGHRPVEHRLGAGKLLMSSRIMACGQALTHAPHPVHAAEIATSFDQGG
jgi:hypothetical protein